jgi:hypothetical protein
MPDFDWRLSETYDRTRYSNPPALPGNAFVAIPTTTAISVRSLNHSLTLS